MVCVRRTRWHVAGVIVLILDERSGEESAGTGYAWQPYLSCCGFPRRRLRIGIGASKTRVEDLRPPCRSHARPATYKRFLQIRA